TDLSPLKGMPLEYLHISGTKVTDISAIRGMPLTSLMLHYCTELVDLSPVADCKGLKDITLPPNAPDTEFLRAFPKLERIGYADDAKAGYRPEKTAAEFWAEYDAREWLGPLLAAGIKINQLAKLPDDTWKLILNSSTISDLNVLKGAPLSE